MKEKDISELIKRYEQMVLSGRSIYFDAEEFGYLAEYYDIIDDIDSAKGIVEKGLLIHPNNYELMIKKAKFMLYERMYDEALVYMSQSFSVSDFDLVLLKIECLLQTNLYADACRLTNELLEDDTNEMDLIYAELGFLFIEADFFDDAISFFEQSLEYNPNNPEVLTELAYAYEIQCDFDAAIKTINKTLDIDPYSYEAWINIGKLYTLQEEYEKAIDAFDFASTVSDNPNQDVLKLKAHCLTLCERTEEAISLLNECLQENPEDESIYISLAECYLTMEQFDDMLTCLEKHQELKGETIEIIAKKAFAYLQKGNLETATELINKGLEQDEESDDLNIVAGELKFQQEDYKEAERFFLKAVEADIENETILDRLSLICIWRNDYEKATEYVERLLLLNPDSPIKMRLAILYFESGDKVKYNSLLESFTNEELKSLLNLFFSDKQFDLESITRETLLNRLNDARDCRQLFKNISY